MPLKTGFEVSMLVKILAIESILAHFNFHLKTSFEDFKVIFLFFYFFRNVKKDKKL